MKRYQFHSFFSREPQQSEKIPKSPHTGHYSRRTDGALAGGETVSGGGNGLQRGLAGALPTGGPGVRAAYRRICYRRVAPVYKRGMGGRSRRCCFSGHVGNAEGADARTPEPLHDNEHRGPNDDAENISVRQPARST